MTNKEKIKESINSDFNKENNYNEIIKRIEGEEMGIKNNIWKWTLVSMCLVVVFGGLLFINFKDNSNNILDTGTFYNDKENNLKIYINNLDNIGMTMLDVDIKETSTNGVFIPWPEALNGITIPKDLDRENLKAIYTRNDKTNEYDILNCYVYTYFNENKDIRVAFSDTNKPIRDYYFSEEGSKETTINDVKLKIFKYENAYFTEFNYKGYNFDIETINITEQELSSLLASIIK